MEGSLKLKEISYIHSESYAAGELKHGTISLIEPGTLVVALAAYEPLVEKMRSNIVEVRSRGAEVVAMTTEETRDMIGSQASEVFVIPKIHTLLQPVLGVVPLQLFAYYICLLYTSPDPCGPGNAGSGHRCARSTDLRHCVICFS